MRSKRVGFTLAELLIALSVVGVIATFTVPKIFSSSQEVTKKAILKEMVSVANELTYNATINNELNSTNWQQIYNNFSTHLNVIKSCPNNSLTEGCRTTSINAYIDFSVRPGFRLSNGATMHFDQGGATDIAIDWNGDSPPNLLGEDVLVILPMVPGSAFAIDFNNNGCGVKLGTASAPLGCEAYMGWGGVYQANNRVIFESVFN